MRSALDEYLHEVEDAFSERLRRLVATCIIIGFLSALAILLLGSSFVFLLIGSVKYLSLGMPVWEAWETAGLIAGVLGTILILALFSVTRKRLDSL